MTFHHIFRHFVSDNIKEDYSRGLLYPVLSHANTVGNVLKLVLVGVIISVVAVLIDKGKSSY